MTAAATPVPAARPRGVAHPVWIAGVALVYFVTARLGLSLAAPIEQVTLVWPPTGIALAAVALLGPRAAIGVAVGAFLANLTLPIPVPPLTALSIAGGNTAEALVGAYVFGPLLRFDASMARLRDVAALLLAAAAGAAVGATLGSVALCSGGVQPWTAFSTIWTTWWLGDAMGAAIVAPALLTWSRYLGRRPSGRDAVEASALFAAVLAMGVAVYGKSLPDGVARHPIVYTSFPLLIVGALRFGQRGATAVILLVAVLAAWGTVNGSGPFWDEAMPRRLVMLHGYLGVFTVTGLCLGAAMTARKRAERRLRADQLVTKILARAQSIEEAAPQILAAVGETLKWEVGAVWRVDRGAGVLRCVETWHGADVRSTEFEAVTRSRTFEPGAGLPGRVWQSNRTVWVDDVVRDTNFPRAPVAARESLHGAFGLPLRLGDEVLGVMEFFSWQIRRPDAELLEMMTAVGGQIGQFMERKNAEEALRANEAVLRENDRRKDEFLATLAHELRNPLAPLSNALHILRLGRDDPSLRAEALAMADRQLQGLVRLVDDLLDVSRITRGKIQLRVERVALADVVARAVETSRPQIAERGHELSVTLPEEPVWFLADPTRMAQVVSNLLNNAARYSDRGGRIRAGASVVPGGAGTLVLTVSDDGMGIAPELLPRVFEPFVQATHDGRSDTGLGIGLALVHRLVGLHGGSVEASSDGLGKGSVFTVRLPLAWDAPPLTTEMPPLVVRAAGAPAADGTPRRRSRVLVADDNQDSARTMALLLRKMEHEVEMAFDGLAAVAAVSSFEPDIVLLDIGMPELDGYEAARRIRALRGGRDITLVALTGWGQAEDRRRSKEAGFDHHLVKPVAREEIDALFGGARPAAAASGYIAEAPETR